MRGALSLSVWAWYRYEHACRQRITRGYLEEERQIFFHERHCLVILLSTMEEMTAVPQRRSLGMCLKRQSGLNKNHNNALAQFIIS